MRNLNWAGGLNRLFTILCIMWVLFIIWYPVYDRRQTISDSFARSLITANENVSRDHDEAAWKQAEQQAETDFQTAWNETGYFRNIKQVFLTPTGIAVVVIPPIILYGTVWGVCFLVRWVARGFMIKRSS